MAKKTVKTKKKMKRSKLWYLAIVLVFAVGFVAGGVFDNFATPPFELVKTDEPVVTTGGETVNLEPVEVTDEIQEVAEIIEDLDEPEEVPEEPEPVKEKPVEDAECVPDEDGFDRCDWAPEYKDFPYSIPERASPKDWVREWEIQMNSRSVTINVQGAILAAFADTNSMDPLFDAGSNAIEIVPQRPTDLQVGDIVSYETEFGTIIHRIIEIGQDEEGWYAIFQGDNNPIPDPEKVRWEQIRRVLVAIIY